MNMRFVVGVSLFLMTLTVGPSVDAATINFNVQVALDPSQIYQCAAGPGPEGTQCWTNLFSGFTELPRTTIGPQDTIRIQLDFLGPYRLQWAHDPFTINGIDQQVQVGTWDSLTPFAWAYSSRAASSQSFPFLNRGRSHCAASALSSLHVLSSRDALVILAYQRNQKALALNTTTAEVHTDD
jgi:hypothetical protein